MITQSELKTLLDYNPGTGELTWLPRALHQFPNQRACSTWNSRYAGKPAFTAIDRKGYRIGAIYNINYRASRIIWIWMTGVNPIQVDHEDGDTLNNKWSNLRNVTSHQNQLNMKRPSNNKSGTIGVSWNTQKQKWDAVIRWKGKHIFLGRFNDINDAIACRKQAEQQYGYHPNHGR